MSEPQRWQGDSATEANDSEVRYIFSPLQRTGIVASNAKSMLLSRAHVNHNHLSRY
jgi:hypothetical protein